MHPNHLLVMAQKYHVASSVHPLVGVQTDSATPVHNFSDPMEVPDKCFNFNPSYQVDLD